MVSQSRRENYAQAQSNLGNRLFFGRDVAKDQVEGYKWLLLAAKQGDDAAKRTIAEFERSLTTEQMAEGKKRAGDFKPR